MVVCIAVRGEWRGGGEQQRMWRGGEGGEVCRIDKKKFGPETKILGPKGCQVVCSF